MLCFPGRLGKSIGHAAQWACGMEVTNHMNQIQIITDAGSDIVDCSRTDLTVLPMTIRFGDEEYLDGVNLTHRQFYKKMIETQVLRPPASLPPMPSRLQSEKSMNRATLH